MIICDKFGFFVKVMVIYIGLVFEFFFLNK